MGRNPTLPLLFVVPMLAAVLVTSCAWASAPDWSMRPGTIGHTLSLQDGSHVYLDAVWVEKIRAKQEPAYFTIRECFNPRDKIAVYTFPSPRLRLSQLIDVEGDLATLPNGCRVITNATVYGYTDQEGNLLRYGPLIKGLRAPTPWEWKIDLTVRSTPSSASSTASVSSDEPNTDPGEAPSYYADIVDILTAPTQSQSVGAQSLYNGIPEVRGLPDGSLVELQCKRIMGVGMETIESVLYNYLDIAEDLPAEDWIRAYSASPVVATSRVHKVTGQIRHVGSEPVIDIDTGPGGYDPQILEGQLQTAAQGTIAWAKTFADGATLPAALENKVVSRTYPSAGYFYIQEPIRIHGIRVYDQSAAQIVQPGSTVTVYASISSQDGERMLTPSSVTITGTTDPPGPLGVNHRVLGGSSFNTYTPGITGGPEAHNVGLLARVLGKVTSVETDCFYLDDGANVDNGTGNPRGVKVTWAWHGSLDGDPQIVAPDVGAYVCVTGVSSSETSQARTNRALRLRKQDDLQIVIPGTEDTTPPTPGISSSPAYCASGSITVSYSGAYDTGSGLKKVELYYKKGLGGTWTYSAQNVSSAASGSFTFSPGNGAGAYYFDLVAEDNASNRSAAAADEGDCSTIYTLGLNACSFSAVLIPPSP